MLDTQLWLQGGITVLIGMGVVFTFLTITIFAISLMAKAVAFIDKVCPPVVEETKTKTKGKAKTTDEADVALAVLVAQKQG